MYEYIDIKQYLPIDIMKRYRFIKELQLTFLIGVYRSVLVFDIKKFFTKYIINDGILFFRYHQGNYLGTINYVWRIPENEDELNETLKVRILARIQKELPQYFTWQMRKNVLNKVIII